MIRLVGLESLIARIDSLAELKSVKNGIKVSAIYIRGKMATYATERHGTNPLLLGRSARAAAMRRGFFGKMRHGTIQFPYRRGASAGSKALGRSWTVDYKNGGFTAIVGNDASYGPLVQDRDRQAQYHKTTGWVTAQDVEENETGTVDQFVTEAVQIEIDRGGS